MENRTRVVKIRRSGGRIVQDCDVYIGRSCTNGGWNLPRSKWANPYSIYDTGSVETAVEKYREYVTRSPSLMNDIMELDGKVLGCWCKSTPEKLCHGDVLVDLVEKRKRDHNT